MVLSACSSAAANGNAADSRLLGGHEVAPLAGELVRGKVPVVVGMAGEVSGHACRLFTRAFGAALVRGLSLVQGTAIAHASMAFAARVTLRLLCYRLNR